MAKQQFTSQELAKFKTADPDEVVSVRIGPTVELIKQIEQLSKNIARVSAENVILQRKKVRLQQKKIRLQQEIAEKKSNVALLEQRISDLHRSGKLKSHNSSKPPSSDGLSK